MKVIHRKPFVLITYNFRIMLFQIENRYVMGWKYVRTG